MDLLFLSKRIYLGTDEDNKQEFIRGGIIVDSQGIIRRVLTTPHEVNSYLYNTESEAVYDFEEMVLMPGLIDTNVHISEPGRSDWEGFVAATKAAAAGGITTIIDRPCNSLPPTTTVAALKAKTTTARGKIYVDVGFWGGLTPGNTDELEGLCSAGVMGLQCSLCAASQPVGDDFPAINATQLEAALQKIDDNIVVAVHAELLPNAPTSNVSEEPKKYATFLQTRPASFELDAVNIVADLALKYKNKPLHLLSTSSAETLPKISHCKANGGNLTVETAPHFLTLAAENIEDCHTEFKSHPPIRAASNQPELWQALQSNCIDIIASAHSPATPGVKCLTYGKARGNFINAWPGISSLQLGLPVIWSHCQAQKLGIDFIHRHMCRNPARLCGLSNFKGKIAEGYDADFCVWNPDEEFNVTTDMLFSAIKSTPYMNQRLRGVVHATIVRGLHVYQQYEGFGQPLGKVLLHKSSKKIVKFVRM